MAPESPSSRSAPRLGAGRGRPRARGRARIKAADPEVVEQVKGRKPTTPAGGRVWEHAGILCPGEPYKDKVKLPSPNGAALPDPAGLFNSSLDGNVRRSIDLAEGAAIDEAAFQALIRAAVEFNLSKPRGR